MKILALDVATKCGWAHSDGPHGVWDLSIKRDESAGMRLIRFRSKLNEILAKAGVDLLVYEAARHAGPGMQGALVVQSELQGVLKLWCESQDPKIEYRGYSPPEIKKHATGKGNAGKDKMLDAYERRMKRPVEDSEHDMVDAWWLLDMVKKEHAG